MRSAQRDLADACPDIPSAEQERAHAVLLEERGGPGLPPMNRRRVIDNLKASAAGGVLWSDTAWWGDGVHEDASTDAPMLYPRGSSRAE